MPTPADACEAGAANGGAVQPRLGPSVLFTYCFFQTCLASIFVNVPTARTYVYKDTLKLPLSTISWMMTAVKSVDILVGLTIGRVSDSLATRFGRRKPFIFVCWPLGCAAILLLVAGGQIFSHTPDEVPCQDVDPSNCSALRECYDGAIGAGTLLPANSSDTALPGSTPEAENGAIELYFLVVYFCYFAFVPSGSQLPYDALGQELTDVYDQRAKLFTWKPIFNLLGAIYGSQLLNAVSGFYEEDTAYAALLTFFAMSCVNLVAYGLLLRCVKERPRPTVLANTKPLAVSLRRLFSVPPYRAYLVMRIPMTVLAQLPYQMLLFYMQNNMEMETVASLFGNTQLIAIVGAMVSTPLMTVAAMKFGRPATITVILACLSVLFIASCFIPFSNLPSLIYVVGPFLGVSVSVPYVIPDAMLGDIIDYDELLTGERNEAMYSMVETNVQQMIEIVLGVATLCMAAAGFDNLGGCECGCGVSCEKQVGYDARWVCPGSIGYACDGSPGAELFYQPEPPFPPCAEQNDGVRWVTALFTFGIPGVAGLLAILPTRAAVIQRREHEAIVEGIALLKANPTASVTDPLTGRPVVRPSQLAEAVYSEQFSAWEWALAKQGEAMGRLKAYLGARLSLYAAAAAVLLAVNLSRPSDYLKQGSFWAVAVLVIAIPLDALRLSAARSPPAPDEGARTSLRGASPNGPSDRPNGEKGVELPEFAPPTALVGEASREVKVDGGRVSSVV